ncbi:hypothetical protein HHK36_006843 [Tetracentron sinense]|uniref:Uncharacterized protein n=1 Tax=Tetracentron sinense TaxID=13715 RepID=A0A834ZM92_TETSI|nr:hypothetical protein HHK36_006843 [Tetracentron sinense]
MTHLRAIELSTTLPGVVLKMLLDSIGVEDLTIVKDSKLQTSITLKVDHLVAARSVINLATLQTGATTDIKNPETVTCLRLLQDFTSPNRHNKPNQDTTVWIEAPLSGVHPATLPLTIDVSDSLDNTWNSDCLKLQSLRSLPSLTASRASLVLRLSFCANSGKGMLLS